MNENIYYIHIEKKVREHFKVFGKVRKKSNFLFSGVTEFFYHMYVISWPSYMYMYAKLCFLCAMDDTICHV